MCISSLRLLPRNGSLICLLLPLIFFWLAHADQPATKDNGPPAPLAPKEEQKTFQVAPGLRVELVACEPQIQSPVAMTFDEDGKLWVVEMTDYPNGPPPGQPPQGRIVVLEDKDGDGFYETRTVFADKLLFANGLLRWKDGVIVTQAPNIIKLRDTDGDGKADKTEILYEGFAEQNPQLRVSHPVLGVDNWIYVANGLRGGKVIRKGEPAAKAISLSGMDFRFDPLSDKHEAISGMGQYGNTFDDWGNRFVCDNRHHLRHVVLPDHYIKRNPFLAVPAVVEDISELGDGPLNSGGKVYPLSKNWTTSNLHAGRFTAACSVFIYRSGLLPAPFQGAAFTCEPTGNLVHCEILTPKGATFSAKPLFDKKEFLATPDDWCRPVFLTDGPDGALYMIDMYRAVIEHPDFMPAELKKRPDLLLGKDKGRIWRIVPDKHKTKAMRPNLSKATTPELVELLCHEHAWYRTTAQRLLLQRQDKAAIKPLRELCADKKKDARGRRHSAWLLHSFKALDIKSHLQLLKDQSPQLRAQGVLLAEGQPVFFMNDVVALAGDPDPRVRFQVALTIGDLFLDSFDSNIPALAKIALASGDDKWTRYAVYSSIPNQAGALFREIVAHTTALTAEATLRRLTLIRELATLAGARNDQKEVAEVLQTILHPKLKIGGPPWQFVALQGLAEGMGQRGEQLGVFLKGLPKQDQAIVAAANQMLAKSVGIAADGKQELPFRLTALALLAHVPWETADPVLTDLLNHDPAKEIRLAAVRSMSAHSEPAVAKVLLKSWKSYTPALRLAVTDALLRQKTWTDSLLAEIEAGRIKPGDIDVLSSKRLLNSKNAEISAKAKKLLQHTLPVERQKIVAKYQASLTLKGDAAKGKKIFEKNCAICHKIGSIGTDVGPDISDSERTKTPSAFLTDILDPNAAIDNNFINYLVMTKGGKVLTGMIATETASSLTLKRASNETDVVLRQDIEEITSTGVSLMPEGLEKDIAVPDMADLLSFLKNWRYLDGSVPVGQ